MRLGSTDQTESEVIQGILVCDCGRNYSIQAAIPIEFVLSNAAYLPFADGYFDAAFHFGGLNTFGEVRRALAEMTRVVRVGGKVVVGDEGIAPWLRQKTFGRILMNANPLYKHRPPIECLPENVCNVGLRWILGNAFYLIDYGVGTGAPRVDVDLPIPGKGDSLRSRYEIGRAHV